MDLEEVSISIILVSILAISLFSFTGAFTSHYANVSVDDDFIASYDAIQDESTRIENISTTMFSYGANSAFSWLPNIGAILQIGTILKNSIGIINQMIQDSANYFGVSPLVIAGFSAILTIMFVFALLRLVIGRGRI